MSRISQHYVITSSVALYGILPVDLQNTALRSQVIACNAFLSRAAYHGAELHVPVVFYSDVTRFSFELYQRNLFDFQTCKKLTQDVLNATWEYHFPTTDDILEVSREFPEIAHTEYLALARDKNYSLIYTDPAFSVSVQQDGILVTEHPWATDGDLDKFPPAKN